MTEGKTGMDRCVRELRDIDQRILRLDIQAGEAEIERKRLLNEKARLESEIDGCYISYDGVRVTEHAVLRYLERVHNIDLFLIAEEMLGDKGVTDSIKTVGAGLIPVRNDFVLRIIDGMVITVLNRREK